MLRLLRSAAIALALSARAYAQAPTHDMLHVPGKDATVYLMTFGDADEQIWELFGHAAIRIHDNATGRDTVLNWGAFDSSQPHFILHFLQGLNYYQMAGDSFDTVMLAYRYANRTIVSQELNLDAAQKDSLMHMIATNALPQNRTYRYDYFVDNCSTRPRDLIDLVIGGQLHAATDHVTPRSYRWHTLRLMQPQILVDLGVDIGLGEPSDKPVTQWQEMFLPRELHDAVATLRIRDSSGALVPLVRSDRVLFQSTRPDEAAGPPNWGPWLLGIGVVLGAIFAILGMRGGLVAGIVLGLWSLVAGILGLLLTALWTVTDHVFAHHNENLLIFNPLWLVLAVSVFLYMWRGRAFRFTYWLAAGLAGLSSLALLAHVVRLSQQNNLAVIGLGLPPALAIAWAVARRRLK